MPTSLIKRRSVWWPTGLGWLAIATLAGIPGILWLFCAETWLAHTQRQPADVLVVEGWIGIEGLRAAKTEFEQGGYQYLVTAGGKAFDRWDEANWTYADRSAEYLRQLGLPADRIIAAPTSQAGNHRTFEAALAVKAMFAARQIRPSGINIFTLGAHARRSRLVFAKVFSDGTRVGGVAWFPSHYDRNVPWWRSSERSLDLIKETLGYSFELLLNSGRTSNSHGS